MNVLHNPLLFAKGKRQPFHMFTVGLLLVLLCCACAGGDPDMGRSFPFADDQKSPAGPEQPQPRPYGQMQAPEQAEDQTDEELADDQIRLFVGEHTAERLDMEMKGEQVYISAADLFEMLGYEVVEEPEAGRMQAGFTDVLYELDADTDRVMIDEHERELPGSIDIQEGHFWIPVDAVDIVLAAEYLVHFENQTLHIQLDEERMLFPGGESLQEAGDRGEGQENEAFQSILETDVGTDEAHVGNDVAPALSRGQAGSLLQSARSFTNTPYKFGAASGDTSQMDCSSFTQHVYGMHGIDLPRTSRAQARMGEYVPASQLRAGDLVFFSWPGRFSSDRIVGHVGIYAGGGRVIHATPSRGVHIVNAADSRYWNSTYLGAKRVS